MTKKEMYLTWLNNAYAMEVDITKTLEGQLGDFADFPAVKKKVEMHLEQTRGHVDKVKECIERNEGSVSVIKEGMASMTGMMKGVGMAIMHDKVIKNSIADYATEFMEIATYRTLIDTAKEVGDKESVPILNSILKEEQEMAKIIEKDMPKVLKEFLKAHEE